MARSARRSITRWIHITDLQVGQRPSDAQDHDTQVEQLIAKVRAEKPDFVINSGDNTPGAVDDDERRFIAQCWRDYHRIVDPLTSECPVFHTPGNHDQSRPGRSLDLYCKHIGRAGKRAYYAANFGDIGLVMLDLLMRVGEYNAKEIGTCRVMHQGAFAPGTAQHRWLRRHLSTPRNTRVSIAVGHWPIFMSKYVYHDTDSSLRYDELTGQSGVLLPMLTEARTDLYLCGHHHVYERSRHPQLMQVMTGADKIAWPGLMKRANRFRVASDYRIGYTRFAFDRQSNLIRGEAVALDGEIMDAWTQKPRGSKNRG